MRSVIAVLLALLLALPVSAAPRGVAKIRERVAAIPVGTAVEVVTRDGERYHGRMGTHDDVSFVLESSTTVNVRYEQVRSLGVQKFSTGHRNHLRDFAIIIGVMVVLIVVSAHELGKS